MQNEKQLLQREFSVTMDMLMDVCKILIDTELKNQITGVNESRGLIQLTIFYQEGLSYHAKALDNIQNMLSDYHHYRFEEEETKDWRES